MTCHGSERKLVPLAPLFGPLRTTLASARPCLFAHAHNPSALPCAAAAQLQPHGSGCSLLHDRGRGPARAQVPARTPPPQTAFARKRAPSHISAPPPVIRCISSRCFARRRRRQVAVRPWIQDRVLLSSIIALHLPNHNTLTNPTGYSSPLSPFRPRIESPRAQHSFPSIFASPDQALFLFI